MNETDDRKAAAQLLERAADWLAAHGWAQGRMADTRAQDGQERYQRTRNELRGALERGEEPTCACAIGALLVAQHLGPATWDAHTPALNVLEGRVGGDVVAWNDAEGRTAEEVIAAMRAAAQTLGGET